MPNKKPAIEVQAVPIRTPKTEPKQASKPILKTEPDDLPKSKAKARPQRTPKPAPINAPMTTPDTYTLLFYSLPDWDSDHSISPHRYGNNGKQLGEFHTEADAKEWLRRNNFYGHFAAVERVNGRIGKSWHIEIESLEEFDFDDSESDLGLLDEDELDDAQLRNPDVVRAKIENARLKAELKAASRNGAQSSVSELLEGVRMLDEMRGQSAPQKSIVEQLREVKEINEIISPRREQSQPTAQHPQLSDDAVILNALANNDAIVSKVKSLMKGFFSDKAEKEEISLADVAMEAVKSGQLSKSIEAAGGALQGIVAMILPRRAEQQPQTPQLEQQTQSAPMAGQATPQPIAPSTPEAAYQQTLMHVLTELEKNAPIEPVIMSIDAFFIQYPQYQDTVCNFLSMPPKELLAIIGKIPGADHLPTLPHAENWIDQLQKQMFPEDDETEDSEITASP